MSWREFSLAVIYSAKLPRLPPKTRSPGEKELDAGDEIMVPANSRPKMKGGLTRERLF